MATPNPAPARRAAPNPWLNRALYTSPIHYCLLTTEAQYRRLMKRMGVRSPNDWLGTGVASTHHLHDEHGDRCAVVCYPVKLKTLPHEVAGVLAHEAMHIWRAVHEHIGEDHPSSEFEAYAMQHIVGNLHWAYNKAARAAARKQA